MSKIDEIRKEIERIEDALFFLRMKDRWTATDYNRRSELSSQLVVLKRQLV